MHEKCNVVFCGETVSKLKPRLVHFLMNLPNTLLAIPNVTFSKDILLKILNNFPACTKVKCQEHQLIKNFSKTNYIYIYDYDALKNVHTPRT